MNAFAIGNNQRQPLFPGVERQLETLHRFLSLTCFVYLLSFIAHNIITKQLSKLDVNCYSLLITAAGFSYGTSFFHARWSVLRFHIVCGTWLHFRLTYQQLKRHRDMNIYDTFVRFFSLMLLLVDKRGRLKFSSQSR